jgi:hypothetical protein
MPGFGAKLPCAEINEFGKRGSGAGELLSRK